MCAVNADGELPIDIAEGKKTKDILEKEYAAKGLDEAGLDAIRNGGEKKLLEQIETMVAEGTDLNVRFFICCRLKV